MKTIIIVMLLVCANVNAQNFAQRNLLGKITTDSLLLEPFTKWYKAGYDQYHPTPNTVTQFKSTNYKKMKYQLFFGSWCGDSKREVPRMIKLLDSLGIPKENVELIGVDDSDSTLKQSPKGEEKGKFIFRVPVFIVLNNDKELGRINEFPVFTLEQDLLSIVKEENYTPNYSAFINIQKWIENEVFENENVSILGLAHSIRSKVHNENQLASVSKLLFLQGKKMEAIKIARINYYLFPDKYYALKTLGDLFIKNNENSKAVPVLEAALKKAEPNDFDECLKLLYKAKAL